MKTDEELREEFKKTIKAYKEATGIIEDRKKSLKKVSDYPEKAIEQDGIIKEHDIEKQTSKQALQKIRDELDDEIEFLDKFISDIRIKKRVEKLWNKRQKIQEALGEK